MGGVIDPVHYIVSTSLSLLSFYPILDLPLGYNHNLDIGLNLSLKSYVPTPLVIIRV